MSAESSTNAGSDLSTKFEQGRDLVIRIDNEDLQSNSQQYQDIVRKAIQIFEELTTAINQLQVFSRNESVDELATSDLKYLLLPAFLAYMTGKKFTPAPADRKDIVTLSNIYFRDYLKRLNEYGVIKVNLDPDEDDDDEDEDSGVRRLRSDPSLESMARTRSDKIVRYRQKKEHEEREKDLRKRIEKGDTDSDEDIVRQYYITLLKKWAIIALEELDGISLEKQMLKHMSGQETSGHRHRHAQERTKRQPLKPFIITKDAAMKQVFGLGYPSIPAMTVDEFVDQKNAEGTWAFSNKKVYSNSLQKWAEDPDYKAQQDEDYDEKLERLDEKEDEDELRRKRDWDEFKDDVKRGEGNRKNMS